ncbi:MAG: hypothetical protein PHQ42_01635 [Patescibacteria group bacterium]|nr:hypothetical protein [Patescibacteria group bacterium]
MAQKGTINDLSNKSQLDGPEEEASVARNLRQARRGGISEENSSLDNLVSLAGGVGGMGTDNRRRPDGSGRDNLGRPVRPQKPLPASRQSQSGGLGSGQTEPGSGGRQPSFAKAAEGKPMGAGGDLDSRLMAGQLREEKNKERERREEEGEKGEERERGGRDEKAKKDKEGEEEKEGKGLRDRVKELKERANLKKRAQKKIEEKVTAPAKQGTNSLLRNAWIHLIDSFGATLLWIDTHVFLHWVLGEKFFCKLGEEWIPKKVEAAGGEAGKAASEKIGLVESAGCCLLNLSALIIILFLIAVIALMFDIIAHPVKYILGAISESFKL